MLNNTLTTVFKDVIKSSGLVASGKLLNSIKVFSTVENFNVKIDIISEDYLKFLVDKYNLIEKFQSNLYFVKEIENILQPELEGLVQKILDAQAVEIDIIPTVTVLLNGL